MNTATKLPSAEDIALAKLSSQELSAVMETNGEAQKKLMSSISLVRLMKSPFHRVR